MPITYSQSEFCVFKFIKLHVKIRPAFADLVTDGYVRTKVWIRNAIHMHCKNYMCSEKMWQPAQ